MQRGSDGWGINELKESAIKRPPPESLKLQSTRDIRIMKI